MYAIESEISDRSLDERRRERHTPKLASADLTEGLVKGTAHAVISELRDICGDQLRARALACPYALLR